MDKKPKTKEVVRTIKEHTVSAAKDKAAAVGLKTKDNVKNKVEEQFSPQKGRKQEQSPESYASDQVTDTAERTAEEAAVLGKRAVKTTVRKIKEKRDQRKEAENQTAESPGATEPDTPETPEPESTEASDVGSSQSSAENKTPSEKGQAKKPGQTPESKTAAPNSEHPAESSTTTEPQQSTKKQTPKEKASVEKKKAESVSKQDSAEPSSHSSKNKQTAKPSDANLTKRSADDTSTDVKPRTQGSEKTVLQPEKAEKTVIESGKKGLRRKTPDQTAIKERKRSAPKEAFKTENEVIEREIKPRIKEKSLPKQRGQRTIKTAGARTNEIRGVVGAPHKAKEVEHGAAKTIKTADKTVKNAQRTAKATKKAAEATAKAAKRSEEAAKRTAKAAAQATKAAIKAAIAGIKAAIAAGKELIAAAAAGSPAAIVIIIVICLIAAVGGTCFGIFLSNDETTGTQITMTNTISQLTAEHYQQFADLKSTYTYDTMEIDSTSGGISIKWKDVLAVYAVKTTTSSDNAYEVATMDDIKMDLLRTVISDMNQINCVVVPTVVSETYTETDASGKTVTKTRYVTKNILKVTVTQLTVDQIAEQYDFSEEQKKQLSELMSPEYDELWELIIGAAGDVLITNSTYIPTDIFSWPMMDNGNITSPYGYRHDPKTGEWKLHGGTDIAAPTGTPILASADGVVIAATWHDSYGYYVKIQHNSVFSTLYGHCSALHVSAGQQVKQGQLIADVGETGYATGPHLHFEVRINDERVDAMQYFR